MDELLPLHPRAIKGIYLFNQKKYFEAHEELEFAWREEKGQIRELYRGILQVGVAYYHIQRKNFPGAKIMIERAMKWLNLFPDLIYGINLKKLKTEAEFVYKTLLELQPEKIEHFNQDLFLPIEFTPNEK